jgi:hypothetical protein
VDMSALAGTRLRVLARELGHACGLPHSGAAENLMLPKAIGRPPAAVADCGLPQLPARDVPLVTVCYLARDSARVPLVPIKRA